MPISTTALHNILRDIGLTHKVVKRNASQQDEEAQVMWHQDIAANFSWEQIIFLDESSKDGQTFYCRFGCALRGERAVEEVPFEHGERWSILPALSLDGYIAVWAISGSFD